MTSSRTCPHRDGTGPRALLRWPAKNDVIDAAAATSVAALRGEANPVVVEDLTTVLALLDGDEAMRCLTPGRPRLADHDHRRTTINGDRREDTGGDSAIQHGWLNLKHHLFDQVTSRADRG